MSRPKKFPETIRVGMSEYGSITILPELVTPELMITGGIRRMAFYKRDNRDSPELNAPPRCRKRHKPAPTPTAPKESDKPPQTQPDAPATTLQAESELPKEENLPKFADMIGIFTLKRKRRTKRELAEIAQAVAKGPAKIVDEDKPQWKCSKARGDCLWDGVAPDRIMKGIRKGKYVCPKCGAEAIKIK